MLGDLAKPMLMKPVIYPEPATLKTGRQPLDLVGRNFIQLTTSHSENFTDRIQDFAKRYMIPNPPKKGNLDLSLVLQSRYVFS